MYTYSKSLMAFSILLFCLGIGSQASAQSEPDYIATITDINVLSYTDGDTNAVIRAVVKVENIGTATGSVSRLLITAENESSITLIPALAPDGVRTVIATMSIPAGDLGCECSDEPDPINGNYHLLCDAALVTAKADVLDQIDESNEGNNTDSDTEYAATLWCD